MALTRIAVGAAPAGSATGGEPGGVSDAVRVLCVANLHASANRIDLAAEDVLRAAAIATEWAGDAPLLFGGDLNLQPRQSGDIFDELRERFGLAPPTAPNAIDHLLARGLGVVERPRRWADERREVAHGALAVRLSDHAPVEAMFGFG